MPVFLSSGCDYAKIYNMYKEEVMKAFHELGYKELLPVQQQAIPMIEQGCSLFLQAETGSGKTAAYLIPILSAGSKALIIAPTRELALQIEEEAGKLAVYTRLRTAALIGGIDQKSQENKLRLHPDLIIATAGRLLDLFQQNKLDPAEMETVVLDEADQILSTGQYDDVRKVIEQIGHPVQTICVSATWNERFAGYLPENFEKLVIHDNRLNTSIDAYHILTDNKKKTLRRILTHEKISRAIIFVNHRSDAERLAQKLQNMNILSAAFSAALEERKRIKILKAFKDGEIRILTATDAAARGLDIPDVSHIIHYDLPFDAETYIHRSGRSAHQQNSGISIALLDSHDLETEDGRKIRDDTPQYDIHTGEENDLTIPLQEGEKRKTNTRILTIKAGRNDKIRPRDIIGALCQLMPFEKIGVLDIQDHYSTVVLLDPDVEIREITIKGKKRKAEIRE